MSVDLLSRSRRNRLFAGLALTIELASPLATASTVTSCADGATALTTPGTLRYEVANAGEGATVDFNLPPECNSTITLETAAISIAQNSLTIAGPIGGTVTLRNDVTGANNGGNGVYDRVIKHTGTGTLGLSRLAITDGYFANFSVQASGGCVYSNGALILSHARISGCKLLTLPGIEGDPTRYGSGGGIAATGSVKVYYSTITGNISRGYRMDDKYPHASCGGVFSGGPATIIGSTISYNKAVTAFGSGGGLCLAKGGIILSSTISGNSVGLSEGSDYPAALARGGGVYAPAAPGQTLLLVNSTISGNTATTVTGGVHAALPTGLFASTIAFNTAGQGKLAGAYAAPGVALFGVYTDQLISTLIAYNSYGSVQHDFSAYRVSSDGPKTTVEGSNDFIAATRGSEVPPYTITGHCAALDLLRDNGGPTKTHALLSFSQAFDEGAVINLGFGDIVIDQRQLPRQSGPFPDVGSYEAQKDDLLFSTNFEQCPFTAPT